MSLEEQLAENTALLKQALPILQQLVAAAMPTATLEVTAETLVYDPSTVVATGITPGAPAVEPETIVAGGTLVEPELVLTWTDQGKALQTTFEKMKEIGWTDESMIAQGHAVMAAAAPVDPAALNTLLGAKSISMGDGGDAIYKLLSNKYKVNGVTELDPIHYPALMKDVQAL